MPSLSLPAALAAALAVSSPAAHAEVIASHTSGTIGSDAATGGFGLGQSVTTPTGGPWNGITFNLFDFATNSPFAEGPLYLLSAPYAGTIAALGNATPGYLADTSTITAGAWDFDDAVTLLPGIPYFFYMASGSIPVSLMYGPDVYAGGNAYQAGGHNYAPSTNNDMNFSLQGTPVTDTPEPASALLLAPALLALLRSRRTIH